ncbi:MAG: ribonuclease Z [Syntrophorhabdales bacterium]
MKIKILGTGTAVPSLARVSSAYLVSTGAGNILVDVGPSIVRRLLESGYSVNDVDVMVLTHFHPDHTGDLAAFLFACNYGESERHGGLSLIGGRGVRPFFRRLSRVYPWIAPQHYRLTIKTLPGGAMRAGPVSVTTAPVAHRDESIAVRIEEEGKRVVFSGDTDYSPALAALASGADLLVAECSFPDRKAKGHLDLPTLCRIAKEAAPRRVIMSHLYPEWEEFHGVIPPPLLLGEDGMELEV